MEVTIKREIEETISITPPIFALVGTEYYALLSEEMLVSVKIFATSGPSYVKYLIEYLSSKLK